MRRPLRPMHIKLFLKQRIHRRIQRKRIPRRQPNPQPPIQIKTPWTFYKQVNFAARDSKSLRRFRIVEISSSMRVVVFGHGEIIARAFFWRECYRKDN